MNWSNNSLSYKVLWIFAPVLILTGVAGFLTPASWSLMSGATPYNIFHLIFGAVGVATVLSKREDLITVFNVGFGGLDLYQAIASSLHWFPESYFHWTRWDDVLHVLLGVALIMAGALGRGKKAE